MEHTGESLEELGQAQPNRQKPVRNILKHEKDPNYIEIKSWDKQSQAQPKKEKNVVELIMTDDVVEIIYKNDPKRNVQVEKKAVDNR